jgi:hypothetical protein
MADHSDTIPSTSKSQTVIRDFRRCRVATTPGTRAINRVTLFARGYAPPHFVEEVLQKDHVILHLLLPRGLGRHERGDAFAVRCQIIGGDPDGAEIREPLLGPHPRSIGYKRIASRRIGCHHDPVVQAAEEQLASVPRKHRVHAAAVRDLPLAPLSGKART